MIKQIILAFFGSIFPVILFNIDRKKIIWAGFCGAIGWATYLYIYNFQCSVGMASFAGAFTVGIYSEFMARRLKTPAIQFSIPGIFPLVPGITAYKTINYIVQQSYSAAYYKGIQVIVAAGAIGFGIMLSTTTFRFISRLTKQNKKNDLSINS